ncbi:MAG: DUF2071 domain-containing protein [Bacteroidetes bacterium]|nr:DUF2071 domain-containing protein [Bacteroidota bacterium]
MHQSKKFLTAEWRKLVFVNYTIDPRILLPLVPAHTELDSWNNKCYISLVGFMFLNTKLRGIPIPFHRNFEEVNLRFYVRYNEKGTWKRGVVFIKEIVPKLLLTLVANSIYKESYVARPMDHFIKEHPDTLEVQYSWKEKNAEQLIYLKAENKPLPIMADSKEEFITEHYWGYAKASGNGTVEYQVQHPRWNIYKVIEHQLKVNYETVYGPSFEFLSHLNADGIMLAEGSEISVMDRSWIE